MRIITLLAIILLAWTSHAIAQEKDTIKLKDVTIVARKPAVEIKEDRTIYNVEKSINATGSTALELLKKTPGIQVDNNDNVSMKGKTGVKLYVDGKMLQLAPAELSAYLKSINSNDIEAIEMITLPGAKYDAAGNAGIINFRLKKNKSFGTNGSATLGFIQGLTPKGNIAISGNYRNKKINIFSNAGMNFGRYETDIELYRVQKDTIYDQRSIQFNKDRNYNIKAGADYFINSKNTIGIMSTANFSNTNWYNSGSIDITYHPTNTFVKSLQSLNLIPGNRTNVNTNINYRYADTSGKEINFDVDHGLFRSAGRSYQPNFYTDAQGHLLSKEINRNYTPVNIDIYTAKIDAEHPQWKGKLGYGAKTSNVKTANTFDFFRDNEGIIEKIRERSNQFTYKEHVHAAYISYKRQLNAAWNFQTGIRAELTNSEGILTRADGVKQADNHITRNYFDLFPSATLRWTVNPKHAWNLAYSKRIDRPGYQDLNPFEIKMDELTYDKGNAFLRPQYTDNMELSHTLMSMLQSTVGYSHVKDYVSQATDTIKNATYVQQMNIATQKIFSFSISSPLPITKWWNGFANIWYNYQVLKGQVGESPVEMSAPSYGAYMQHSFTLGKDYTAEVSGWYNGPSIWGVTFKTKSMSAIDIGFQKLLLDKRAALKVSLTDAFNTTFPWRGHSNFRGLSMSGRGAAESRTFRVSFTYRFGSDQVTAARERQAGMESESKRIKPGK